MFVSVSFVFSLNFSLCLLKIIVRPFISSMAKSEVYYFLASKLDHFENDIQRHLAYRYLKHFVIIVFHIRL